MIQTCKGLPKGLPVPLTLSSFSLPGPLEILVVNYIFVGGGGVGNALKGREK